MLDLNIRHCELNALGEPTAITFRCGCRMRSIGPGLVMRSCCRQHEPLEPDDAVALGALPGGPWLTLWPPKVPRRRVRLPVRTRPQKLVPPTESESQTKWYQFRALRRRIRAAAWRFFNEFEI